MPRGKQDSSGDVPTLKRTALASQSAADSQHSRPRKKRNRYTPHACNRCKAAKVRCDGRLPCSYCSTRDATTCHYTVQPLPTFQLGDGPTENDEGQFEQRLSTLLRPQNEKLDLLIKRTERLDATNAFSISGQFESASSPPRVKKPLPLFQSPTSAFCCINIIGAQIEGHGSGNFSNAALLTAVPVCSKSSFSIIQGQILEGETSDLASRNSPDPPGNPSPGSCTLVGTSFAPLQPLDEMEDHEILQMLNDFECMAGITYPILDMVELRLKTQNSLQARQTSGFKYSSGNPPDTLEHCDATMLKLVVAISLLAEGDVHKDLASRLFQSTQSDVQAKVWDAVVNLKDLGLLILVVFYHLHRGTWRVGWRFLGNISRIIFELGLTREIVLARVFPDSKDRVRAINTIWTVFILEQHLSYALGLPNAMQGLRLDSTFPPPVNAPFLKAMIEYARIGREACSALLGDNIMARENHNVWQNSYTSFQCRIDRWALDTTIDFHSAPTNHATESARQYLETLINLRANHMRTLVARAFLCTELRTTAPVDIWAASVDNAADTVHVLSRLDTSSKEYRFHRPQLNHFLISALDLLLFACTSDPSRSAPKSAISLSDATCFKARQSSMVALNLLRTLAEVSDHSKNLWEKTRGVASRLNLTDYLVPDQSAPGQASAFSLVPDPPEFDDANPQIEQMPEILHQFYADYSTLSGSGILPVPLRDNLHSALNNAAEFPEFDFFPSSFSSLE